MFELLISVVLLIVVILIILAFFRLSYVVVPPHEAHVVISRGKGKKVRSSREGQRSSYWRLPIIQQRAILPIENIQIQVEDVPLRDKNMAKFLGDVVAWLNIVDPLLAAERLGKLEKGFASIEADVKNVIQAVTRNMSMYWTLIDIMINRKEFSQSVEKAINEELEAWGIKLVELEVIHFEDTEGYTVIKDLERRQSTVISAETRKQVAEKYKEAEIVESNAKRESEIIKAKNEEEFRTRQIEKDEGIGKREQDKEIAVQEKTKEANERKVEAERTYKVGQAETEKQAIIRTAEGEAEAEFKKGEAKARVTRETGTAEADVIRNKGFAEAESTDKRAEALKKYNEAGITLEYLKAVRDVEINKWDNWGDALQAAKIQVYSGGEQGSLLGIPISPSAGFSLGAFAAIAKEQGFDIQKVAESLAKGTLPVAGLDVTKLRKPPEKKPEEKPEEGEKDVRKGKSDLPGKTKS